jgi:phosphocarrier protein HPr
MPVIVATRTVTVVNHEGVHLRAATLLGNLARRFDATISVAKGNLVVDAKSTPLHLLALGADHGEDLVLKATGDDAEEALAALAELFAACFPEPTDPQQPATPPSPGREKTAKNGPSGPASSPTRENSKPSP